MAPITAGGRFAASLSRYGQRLAEARITLEDQVENTHAMLDRPTLRLLQFPKLELMNPTPPEVNEFAELPPDKVHVMADGIIRKTAGKELALELEESGYAEFKAA